MLSLRYGTRGDGERGIYVYIWLVEPAFTLWEFFIFSDYG